jgi:phage shock protein E
VTSTSGTNSNAMTRKAFPGAILLALLLSSGCSLFHRVEAPVNTVSVTQAERVLSADTSVVVLDVRTTQEWQSDTGHLKGALFIPIQELEANLYKLAPYKSRTIIVYCRTGGRSARAARLLSAKGFNVFSMEGGITKWNTEDLPVVKEASQ